MEVEVRIDLASTEFDDRGREQKTRQRRGQFLQGFFAENGPNVATKSTK